MGNREEASFTTIVVDDAAEAAIEEPPGSAGSTLSAFAHQSLTFSTPLAVPVKRVAGASRSRLVRARSSSSLTPLHSLGRYETSDAFVADQRPSVSVHLMRPAALRASAQWFIRRFPGTVMYAVKANPTPYAIKGLYAAGIRHFDVASLAEVELVSALAPKARLHFMHPVKSREAIRKSYFTYGVRDFVVDSAPELFKLLEETQGARDLGILIRLAVNNSHAVHALSGKFGADVAQTADLLQQARKVSSRLGIAFHVGQQTMNPEAYRAALVQVGEVVKRAKINPDIVDVGGGFPVSFPGLTPPNMGEYMRAISEGFAALNLPKKTKLWCEPGRALVQEAGSLIVKVELRKDNRLYINDGVYGSLFDAGISKLTYPMRLIRPEGPTPATKMAKFYLLGPTCDSIDMLKTAVSLPADIEEGDWIEIGQTGGYAVALQSRFNGFGADERPFEVQDAPLLETPGFWQDETAESGEDAASGPVRVISL
jgi:ornithine decarboxylase